MFPKCVNGFVYIYSCCPAKGSLLRIHISSQLQNFTHNKTKEIITAICIYSIFLWPTLVPCVDFSAHLLSHVVFSNPLPTLVYVFFLLPTYVPGVCMYVCPPFVPGVYIYIVIPPAHPLSLVCAQYIVSPSAHPLSPTDTCIM